MEQFDPLLGEPVLKLIENAFRAGLESGSNRSLDITDKAEIFACQWLKARQFLTSLPGTTKRGDDLYNAVFGEQP